MVGAKAYGGGICLKQSSRLPGWRPSGGGGGPLIGLIALCLINLGLMSAIRSGH